MNNFVQPIRVPMYGAAILKDSEATVSGWGAENTGTNKPSTNLLYANLKIVGNKDCDKRYDGYIADSQICATETDKGFCYKDQGNPLVQNKLLIGIASWSIGCADNNHPGVYTRVDRFADWINEYVKIFFTPK